MLEGADKNRPLVDIPEFPDCFVCGRKNPQGLQTKFTVQNNEAKASFVPDKTLVGYHNAVHGGILSALLDEVIIWACYGATRRFGVTAELNVKFRKPVVVDKKYSIEGRLVDDKGKVWIAEARIMDDTNSICASAVGKVIPMSKGES